MEAWCGFLDLAILVLRSEDKKLIEGVYKILDDMEVDRKKTITNLLEAEKIKIAEEVKTPLFLLPRQVFFFPLS